MLPTLLTWISRGCQEIPRTRPTELTLRVGVGGNAILAFALGVMQTLAFVDTNMLVSPK